MSESTAVPAPDPSELAERVGRLRTRFGEFRGRL
jgi:hypothetical protein